MEVYLRRKNEERESKSLRQRPGQIHLMRLAITAVVNDRRPDWLNQ
jgi:hypothetical protein